MKICIDAGHFGKYNRMNIDNADYQMGYIRSDEAGEFLAFLVENDYKGAINGSSDGTISLRDIINYVEQRTDSKAIITPEGDEAPFNGECSYSINNEKAENLGFSFSNLNDWIFSLIDFYINKILSKK